MNIKFLLDRGAIAPMSVYYRRPPLVQGDMKIPCKVTFQISPRVKSRQFIDCLIELAKSMYSKPDPPVLLNSTLSVEYTIILPANEIFIENHNE